MNPDSIETDSNNIIKSRIGPIGEKTFINKLLGEMKNQFNTTKKMTEENGTSNYDEIKSSPQESEEDSDVTNLPVTTDESPINNNEETEEEKPRIVLLFKKPTTTETKPKDTSPNRRSSRTTSKDGEDQSTTATTTLKRSSRRRSKDSNESVLQSAIARKEKSYNESNKPQRLTRQLKPTKKILENLAMAKQEKTKTKVKYDSSDNNCDSSETDTTTVGVKKRQKFNQKKNVKRLKSCDNSDDSDQSDNMALARRSQRISTSRYKEENSMDVDEATSEIMSSLPEQSHYPNEPECSSVGAELIASRLCLCTKKTQLYPYTENKNDEMFCMATDNIGDKIVGCSRVVKDSNVSLLRPSSRVPYILLCDLHSKRLWKHNCCPTCGIFCTQGRFVECINKHQYHRDCQISVGNMECCPHCGVSTPPQDVLVTMYSSRKPVFLPYQKAQYPSAKMSFQYHNNKIDNNSATCNNNSSNSMCSITPPIIDNELLPSTNQSALLEELDEFTENDLLDVVKSGDLERLAIILGSKTVDLNFKIADFNDGTILHYAAQMGLLPVVHMLVVCGMELDVFDKEQNSPLMLAVTTNRNDVVQYLIRAGASITLKGTDGMTALHLAAKSGNLQAAEMLLQAGANIHNFVNSQDDGGWTPLVWACEHGYVDVANYLIGKGADASLRDVEHNVALHWAAFSGSCRIAELLLNKGCEVNAVNAHGDTPLYDKLHIGAREDRYNCIIVLLARGANVGIVNKNSETALDCVPDGGDSYNVIALNVQLQGTTLSDEGQRRSILSNDISKGKENNPIQCINLMDDDPLPKDYVYISRSCITSDNIDIDRKLSTMNTCSCEERCSGDCCSCTKMSIKCWYDEEGKLSADFNYADSPLIFECNDACNCNAITCNNRVVQKGLTQRFQLFKTECKGWGVSTLRFIPKGSFVCEYIGEILTDVEADQREDDTYLFDLDNRSKNESESFCIDAKYYGNFARFINHSCNANLHPVKVFVDHQDLRFPRIAFFANRDILVDEELSFDYGDKFWLVKYKSFTCQCELPECKYSVDSIQNTINNSMIDVEVTINNSNHFDMTE